MKLYGLLALVPIVSAACDTSQNQLSLTFMVSNFDEYAQEEVCPIAGSCVNMESGPDSWSQKANWVIMEGATCVRFYDAYDCPDGAATWEPPCYEDDWAVFVLSDWQNGVMKSYAVWKH